MGLIINTEPAAELVSLGEIKAHLRIDEDDTSEDIILEKYIKAARRDCENFQGRAYINQTWELWLDAWPSDDFIRIPRPPLQSVSSVKYYDTSDTEATFSSSYYFVDTKERYGGRVGLNYGQSWPSTTLRPRNGICVTFVAGYGAAASAVPADIVLAVMLLTGHYYENREAVITTGMNLSKLPMGVESLLWKERVF